MPSLVHGLLGCSWLGLPSPPFEAFRSLPFSKQPSEKLTEFPVVTPGLSLLKGRVLKTNTPGLSLLKGSVLKTNTDGCKLHPEHVPC